MKNILKISSVLVTLALLVSIVLVNGMFASAGDTLLASWESENCYSHAPSGSIEFYGYAPNGAGEKFNDMIADYIPLDEGKYLKVTLTGTFTDATDAKFSSRCYAETGTAATTYQVSFSQTEAVFVIPGPCSASTSQDYNLAFKLPNATAFNNIHVLAEIYQAAGGEESEEESVVIEESEEESAPAPIEESEEESAPAPIEESEEESAPAPIEESEEESAPAPIEESEEESAPAPIEESEEESAPAPIEESEEESAPAPIEESEEESVEESAPAEESEEESEMIKTNIITVSEAVPEQFRTLVGDDGFKVTYPIGKAVALKDGEYYEVIGSVHWVPVTEGGWGGDFSILNGEQSLFATYLDGTDSTPVNLTIDNSMVSEGDQLSLFCIEDAFAGGYDVSGTCALVIESLEVNLYTFPEEEESVEESAPIEESEDVSVEESEEPVPPEYKNFIKNGDFSDGINNWNTNGDVTVDEDGVLNFGGSSSFTQKVAVDPTKTYTLTGIAGVKSATEMWNYAYLRGTYYDASGAKIGSKIDLGGALLQYNASKGELNKSTELPVELNKQFGAETSFKIPEDAAYLELSFESSTDGVVWTLDDLCLIDGETLAGEDEESEEESDAEESTEPGEESTEPGEESTVPGDESEDVSEEEPSEDESADTSIDESGDTSDIEVLAGDAIPDGVLDMKDVLAMRKVIAKMAVEGFNAANADFNGDGALDMKDVLALRKTIAGIEL